MKPSLSLIAALLCWLVASTQTSATANVPLESATHAMMEVDSFQQASISPNGKEVAWVETAPLKATSYKSAIYLAYLNVSVKSQRVTAGNGKTVVDEHDVAWSLGSNQIAFLSDAAGRGQLQLFVADINSGQVRQLTHLNGYLSSPQWSRSGQYIGFLFTENATRASGRLLYLSDVEQTDADVSIPPHSWDSADAFVFSGGTGDFAD